MLRLGGFFVLVLLVMRLVQAVPGIGHWFRGLLGFWLVAIVVSLALSRLTARLLSGRKLRRRIAELSHVQSAHNLGKLGALYVAHGRNRAALEPLGAALESEPENLEWRYRLGQALLTLGRCKESAEELARVAASDEEYHYGGVQMRLAEARNRLGDADGALSAIDRFERNHGENPESAYRRGLALRLAGRKQEARASFARVGPLARQGLTFRRRESASWAARAFVARWI